MLGPQHPGIATSYDNLVVVLGDHGKLKQGKEYNELASNIT